MKYLSIFFYFVIEYLLILKLKILAIFINNIPDNWNTGNKNDVVIIPGVHEPWMGLYKIGNSLNKLGYKIHIIPDLGQNTKPIELGVTDLKNCTRSKQLKNIVLIGHSKGGIVVRKFLTEIRNEEKIYKAFTIATPNGGSYLAHIFQSTKEIAPNSLLIKNLNSKEVSKKIINVYPKVDNHVVPHASLHLNGVVNEKVDVVGHTRILFSDKTIKLIIKYLN